jgi:GNAT superfamily N-acetyltransferase
MPVREGTPGDVPELVRVINRAYRVEDFFVRGDRVNAADVTSRLATPGAAFLVIDGAAPGSLDAAVCVQLRGDRGYFGLLAVDPDRQGHGLARELIAAVEARCRAAGCRHLDLDVVDLRTELPPFYARLGFAPSGTAPFKDADKLKRPASLIVMSKPLAE